MCISGGYIGILGQNFKGFAEGKVSNRAQDQAVASSDAPPDTTTTPASGRGPPASSRPQSDDPSSEVEYTSHMTCLVDNVRDNAALIRHHVVHRALPPELAAGLLLGPLVLFAALLAFLYVGLSAFGMSVTLGMLLGAPVSGKCVRQCGQCTNPCPQASRDAGGNEQRVVVAMIQALLSMCA